MRFVCLSDTHGLGAKMPAIPDGDVLLHAGDHTNTGSVAQMILAMAWLAALPHPHKVAVAGNHDHCLEATPYRNARVDVIPSSVTYLLDSAVTIDGINIWGTPWQPEFYNWAFNVPRGGALRWHWAKIPDDTHVLLVHGPPYGIGDRVRYPRPQEDPHVGCPDLRDRIAELSQLKLVVFGHIHEGYGQWTHRGVQYVNASVCDEKYRPVNPAIVVDL